MGNIKVKLLRALTKKNYGIVRFKNGIHIHPRVMDLGKGNVKFRGGLWLFDKDSIYYEHKDKEIKKIGSIEDLSEFDEGIPVVTLDAVDAVACKYSSNNDDIKGSRNPYALEATIDKHISATEAEIMRKTKSKIAKMMLVNIIMVLAVLGVTIYIAAQIGGINHIIELLSTPAAA